MYFVALVLGTTSMLVGHGPPNLCNLSVRTDDASGLIVGGFHIYIPTQNCIPTQSHRPFGVRPIGAVQLVKPQVLCILLPHPDRIVRGELA